MLFAHLRIFATALLFGIATQAVAQDKVRFQTDWIPSGEHAMYYGAWREGIFASARIEKPTL